jgi:hypothetical protein
MPPEGAWGGRIDFESTERITSEKQALLFVSSPFAFSFVSFYLKKANVTYL